MIRLKLKRALKRNKFTNKTLIKPIQRFMAMEASSGIVLFAATIIALVWSNLSLGPIGPVDLNYEALWHTPLAFRLGAWEIAHPLHFWINDALMVIFFLLVGLEIKREIVMGELSSIRQSALPILAAVGGMLFPALIYSGLNPGGVPEARGWAIPTATDIAFALGVLTLFGKRIPLGLKVFLTALAIVDDLGAVLIIALFYSNEISLPFLLASAGIVGLLMLLNRRGVKQLLPYLVLGFALWLAVLGSGVHATIAGVLLALTIPVHATKETQDESPEQAEQAAETSEAQAPLIRLEHRLQPWASYVIMPLFALANAGLALHWGDFAQALSSKLTIGVMLGLVLGKQLGISVFSWLAVKTGLARLPNGVSWLQIYGVSCLAGIGFTMSLFIAHLSFQDAALFTNAQVGIFVASMTAALWGCGILAFTTRQKKPMFDDSRSGS